MGKKQTQITQKKKKHLLFLYKYNKFNKILDYKISQNIFLAEYVNLFWQQQWVYEWVSSYKFLKRLPIYIRRTNFIDITRIINYNIYHFYNNPFKKKKKQIKKKTLPKNKFSTGFLFGFSFHFKKQLQNIN